MNISKENIEALRGLIECEPRNVVVLSHTNPDGDALVYEIVSYPKHGSVILSDAVSGKYIYRPTAGYTGKDSFKYTARDEWGNYAGEAEVRVTVSRFSDRRSRITAPSSRSLGSSSARTLRRNAPMVLPQRANCCRWNRAMAQRKKDRPRQRVFPLRTAPSQRMPS